MVFNTNGDRVDVSGQQNIAQNHIDVFDPNNAHEIRSAYKNMNGYGLQNTAQHVNPMDIAITPVDVRNGSLGLNNDGVQWTIVGVGGRRFQPEPVYQKGDEDLPLDKFLDTIIGRISRNKKGEQEALGMTPDEYRQWSEARAWNLGNMGG